MKVIIHAGMHKTGSSSIQQSLARADLPGVTYAPWRTPNHSALYALLFFDDPARYHGFRKLGTERGAVQALRDEWQTTLEHALAQTGNDTFVFSAEDITGRTQHGACTRMVEFFRRFTDDIDLIAYVRPPVAFMQSAFQQRVKGGGPVALDPQQLWPAYRDRFEELLSCFDPARVNLRLFTPQALEGGDAVTDFAAQLGVTLNPADIVRANESIPLEAIALLYTQRKLGTNIATGFPKAMAANAQFIKILGRIGSGKLRFGRPLVEQMFAQNADDLAWMEAHLGAPLADLPDADAAATVNSDEDLFAIAQAQAEPLRRALAAHQRPETPRDALIRDLEALYRSRITAVQE